MTNLNASENYAIPAATYQIYVLWVNRFVSNTSVINTNTSMPLTQIFSGTPLTGEYIVTANGIYTFAAADVGVSVQINYVYEGIVTASRSLLHWNDVSPALMPALYMVQKDEDPKRVKGLPYIWTLNVDVYLYINSPNDPDFIPAQLLNPLLDQIESLLEPPPSSDTQTLNGLVSHCWISSKVMTAEGQISDGEIALIPISILLPS